MDEDLDKTVDMFAKMLLQTDNLEGVWRISHLLETASLKGPEGQEFSARIVQELAAYQGGSILEKFLSGVLWEVQSQLDSSMSYVRRLCDYNTSCQALSSLTGSKVAVKRCLTVLSENERNMAQQIYKRLSENALKVARSLKDGEEYREFIKTMIVAPLLCVSNFVNNSRIFRAAIRDSLEGTTIPDSLGN